MRITKGGVVAFKEIYCNENRLIAELLREKVAPSLKDPILDVGAGMGDISSAAFPNQHVVLLDLLDYSNHPTPALHEREQAEFFAYDPKARRFGTIFLCHVLQFIDDDVPKLNHKLRTLNADKLVVVANCNDDFMGDLIKWFNRRVARSNPEVALPRFPQGYSTVQDIPLTAQITCPDYEALAQQIAFLMDSQLSKSEKPSLTEYLTERLRKPSFSINEKITVYRRTGA